MRPDVCIVISLFHACTLKNRILLLLFIRAIFFALLISQQRLPSISLQQFNNYYTAITSCHISYIRKKSNIKRKKSVPLYYNLFRFSLILPIFIDFFIALAKLHLAGNFSFKYMREYARLFINPD